ncbi:MAG: FlgD immunoglobulin-like domain containing protein [bacterium]
MRLRKMRNIEKVLLLGLSLAIIILISNVRLFGGGNCNNTSTGMIPLTDLGSGLYKGVQSGLFPDGLNVPPEPYASDGLAIANSIRPLNSNGQVDEANGKIGLVTIGMSNTNAESKSLVIIGSADPDKSASVVLVNGAQGGKSADKIADPNEPYWSGHVIPQVARAGLSVEQVQVAWVKEATPMPTEAFPTEAVELQGFLEAIARNLKALFPNLKIAYYSSRIYAGYATGPLNPEPHAYETGFSVKWMLEKQINGDAELNYDPNKGDVVAPYVTWGPYLWADGLTPRSDGLIWECDDLANDGTHPSDKGSDKVANLIIDFLKTDPTATPWFLKQTTTAVELSSFNSVVQGANVVLRWVTARETNNYGFEIQRKQNSSDFEKIAFVQGRGSSSAANTYEYVDKHLQPGSYTYRLKQLDFNGSSEFSTPLTVAVAAPREFKIEPNFPNPFRTNTTLFYQLPERATVTVRIYNVLGQEVSEFAAGQLDAGFHSVQWNGLDKNQRPVAAGMYFVTLWKNGAQGNPQLVAKRKILHIR